ncbi:MAG TPA: PAS domain-containing sensor histidine kinase [Xanthobacteraceae bacterium]
MHRVLLRDVLLPGSAPLDRLASRRHRAFVTPRLLGGLVMLVALAVAFVPRGWPSAFESALLGWPVAAFVMAYLKSRAGQYESAHVLSALGLTGLVTMVAFSTGGLSSFAAIWLVVVPVEAALAGSRRVVALACVVALGAAGFLLITGMHAQLPLQLAADQPRGLAMLGIVSALLYATGLALGAESLVRTDFWLSQSEEVRYRLLARDMAEVITRHGRNGQVLFVSPAAEALFGTEPHDLRGRGLFERVHVADRPAYLTALSDAATLRASRTMELRVRRDASASASAGGFVWIEMRCWPLDQPAQDDAAVCEVVAVMRDVTARKDEERALEDARAESERANVAKSRFLATMSHELRTPLNAIIGFSEMLREEGALMIDAKQRHDYVHLINESGHHLLSVVNGILDMSKIESGHFEIMPEPVVTQRVIAECCELLMLRARAAGVEIVAEVPDALPVIVADKRALLQIMLNLLSNAVKFTNRGGSITVAARAETGQKIGQKIGHEIGQQSGQGADQGADHGTDRASGQESAQESGHIVITVEDTGVGIGAEDLSRVGEPFFQALSSYDRRHDGTGLGVSIVKGLLALHGGWMAIESHVGEGTRVIVHLPLDCESARRRSETPTMARIVPGAKAARSDIRSDLRADSAVKKSA